jgi:hypothetical protein
MLSFFCFCVVVVSNQLLKSIYYLCMNTLLLVLFKIIFTHRLILLKNKEKDKNNMK